MRDPGLRLVREPLLLRLLGGLHLRDLILDAAEEPLALGELAADLIAFGRALGDDALLLGARHGQLRLALPDLGPEAPHLVDDPRVLFGQAVDRIDAVEQVVQARRAEKNLERALLT